MKEQTKPIPDDLLQKIKAAAAPAGYRVLIADFAVEEKTTGGIFLPEQVQDAQRGVVMRGVVVSLGHLAYMREDFGSSADWCSAGDTIIFSKYAGVRFRVEDHPCRVINDDEVQAVIKNSEVVL